MQILIDIDEDAYKYIKANGARIPYYRLTDAIKNGTPLPKGHGRLIDESDLIPDTDYEDGTFYAVSIGAINGAPTIVEADRSEEKE